MIQLSGDSLSTLSEFLSDQIGLYFPPQRWRDLERGIASAAREFDFNDPESCIQWLLSSRLSRRQIEILSSHLTVGETYFFREKKTFEALQQHVLPELIRLRTESGKRLRIWCAGCCTGEEPYSIAILLDQVLPDIEDWNITVLGTDINPRFLQKACEGIYGQWSFRDTPPWFQEKYFKRTKDGRFAILPELKKKVVFSYLNLAEDCYPSLFNNTNAMDLIFCRNVLMYFSSERATTAVGNLHRSLVEDGWLIVSPTETSTVLFSQFQSTHFPGVILYQKTATAAQSITTFPAFEFPTFHPEPSAFQDNQLPAITAMDTSENTLGANPQLEPPQPQKPSAQMQARMCANSGNIEEARKWIDQAIQEDKLNASFHYLRATILQEQGETEEMLTALNRTLYIDPNFVLAHFTLATLCARAGKVVDSKRHFRFALELLAGYDKQDLLPEADGITAGRLMEIIESSIPGQEFL